MRRKLAVVGFDSVSLPTLDMFVQRGVMPNVAGLMDRGAVTQTWPCFPMETGTNWASLATGASPAVTGCNMHMRVLGTDPDRQVASFPSHFLKAEPLWTTVQNLGGKAVIFDWAHSFPLTNAENIVHIGEDGRPDNAVRALQEAKAYTTHPQANVRESVRATHLTEVRLARARGWSVAAPETAGAGSRATGGSGGLPGPLELALPIEPGPKSRYSAVEPLFGLLPRGPAGYDRVLVYRSRDDTKPLLDCRPGRWTDWVITDLVSDGTPVNVGLRAKLLSLDPDGSRLHLYFSEIYSQEDFVHPATLTEELVRACGPYVIQCSRQQVVTAGVSDVGTYFDEQYYLADWYRTAAEHLLADGDWDLFMLKWHGPDWTNHLTMHMIDPRHPMYEEERAAEGWAFWDALMARGDEIVRTVVEAAGPDAVIALVSDHGGGTHLPGAKPPADANPLLEERGWLRLDDDGAVNWRRSVAYATNSPYVYINLKGRDPHGIVEPGAEYERLRTEIIRAILGWTDGRGRPVYQAVLPVEVAGRLGVGGDVAGDIFMIASDIPDEEAMTREEFRAAFSVDESGTWDRPRLNTGSHTDDSYFVLAGPGVRMGYRNKRPTLITSVAPTMALAAGLPVPKDADGAALWNFLE